MKLEKNQGVKKNMYHVWFGWGPEKGNLYRKSFQINQRGGSRILAGFRRRLGTKRQGYG